MTSIPDRLTQQSESRTAPANIRSIARSAENLFPLLLRNSRKRVIGSHSARAFSLVEVVMAIGITSFASLAIVGLIPVGLNSFHQTKLTSVATQISEQIFSEMGSASYSYLAGSGSSWRLPAPGATTTGTNYVRYFNDQGEELAAAAGSTTAPAGTIYQANVGARYAPMLSGASATNNSYLVQLTIQVAYNPANMTMDFMPSSTAWGAQTLWAETANNSANHVSVFDFQTMVAGDATSK